MSGWCKGDLIHDHFEGSANCVQCKGPCRLTGGRLLATQLVRWDVERWARADAVGPDQMEKDVYDRFGIDLARAKSRARSQCGW